MTTREDIFNDELFGIVKTILSINALGETLRNQPLSLDELALREDRAQLVAEIGQGAARGLVDTTKFLLEVKAGENQESPMHLLTRKTLMLAKSFILVQNPATARALAYQVALRVLGRDAGIPGPSDSGVFNDIYQSLGVYEQGLLLESFGLLSACSCFQRDWFQALSWLEELQVLNISTSKVGNQTLLHDWERYRNMDPITTAYLIEGLTTITNVLVILQNTGAYHYFTVVTRRYIRSLPDSGSLVDNGIIPNKAELLEERKHEFEAILDARHPDPEKTFNYVLIDSRLQVSGAWKRLPVKPNEIMGRRCSSNGFIWNGHLYIAGGVSMGGKEGPESYPQNIWRLRLDPLGDWQLFSKLPPSTSGPCHRLPGMNIKVYKGKGYLFTGNTTLDILDLKTGRWSKLKTMYRPTAADRADGVDTEWPFSCLGKNYVAGAAQQIVKDLLLVFGGIHMKSLLGCNLLMELNLKTLRWRRLNGYTTVQRNNSPNLPGPRYNPASWVDNGRLFILYGICERIKPGFGFNNDTGPLEQWIWDDMWSWDVEQEKWRRERISGNLPAPRYEMGYAYNEKLKKVIIFGGVNSSCSHRIKETGGVFDSAIYADTFMLSTSREPENQMAADETDPEGSKSNYQPGAYCWKQVMTHGFPTYRAGSTLVCDPDTGIIYMYGGRGRGEFAPNRNYTVGRAAIQGRTQTLRSRAERPAPPNAPRELTEVGAYRHFGHVWQLHIDIPGGHFESIDEEDEMRTAPPGPWDRCFECGKADFWKQCGGTCGGRAHFCSRECQVKGWKLHKQMHGCKKS